MTTMDFYSRLKSKQSEADEGDIPDFYSLIESSSTGAVPHSEEFEKGVPDFYSVARPTSSFDKLKPRQFEVEGKRPNSIPEMYLPPEMPQEEFNKLSSLEKMQHLKGLEPYRDFQRGEQLVKLGKGATSGLTMGTSEYIPGLETEEQDFMTDLGHVIGSYVPIAGLYKVVGAPLVKLAAKSPIAKGGLMALARMTGFGATGAVHRASEELIKGEVPSPSELLKTGAEWAAIDAAMQALGFGVAFNQSINRIAKAEGVTAKEVLEKLWDSTKGYIKSKYGRTVKPTEILAEDVEALFEQATRTEAAVAGEKAASEPVEVQGKAEKGTPIKPVGLPEGAVLRKPEDIRTGMEGGKASASFSVERDGAYFPEKIALTPDERKLIDASNQWDKAGDLEEASKLAQQAREMIFDRIKGRVEPVAPPAEKKVAGQSLSQELFGKEVEDLTQEEKDIMGLEMIINDPHSPPDLVEQAKYGLQVLRGEIKGPKTTEKPKTEPKVLDERPILKEIYDLKEKLKAEKSKSKKSDISNDIRLKVDELAQIRKKNKALEKERIRGSTQQDVSTKGLKEQKKYILEKVDEALENPPTTNQVTIDVPGDGLFKIDNEPRNLENFRKRVEKEWPTRGVKEEKAVTAKGPEFETEEEALPKKRQTPSGKTRPLKVKMGKEEAVARSKILDLFRKAFTDPIRLGKFRQRASGIHKLWPRVTRLLQDNDIETAAHEIGHNLHTVLYGGDAADPQEQVRNINTALRPYLNELKPLAHYEPFGPEGFAEFTRLYVTNPDVAEELAPNFYVKFGNDLDAQYPELKNALLEAREYYFKYLHGTPQSRIRAQTNYSEDKGMLANIIESVKDGLNLDNLKTQFLDDVYPAKKLVAEAFGIPVSEVEGLKDPANLYRSLRLLKGTVGKGDVFVLHETFDPKTLDKINGSLRDILKKLPDEESYREFNDYLIARRVIEKKAQGIETGIETGDALAVEADLRDKYGDLAKELDQYNTSLLQYAQKSGLLSPQQYNDIKKKNLLYVPFQRVMEPHKDKGGIAAGGGRIQAGKPFKRMTGSSRDIVAPIESVLKNTYAIIINSEKNLAGQVLAKIAMKKGVGAYVEAVPTPIGLKAKVHRDEIERSVVKHLIETGQDHLLAIDANGKVVLSSDVEDIIPDLILKFGPTTYPPGENIVTVYVDGKPKYYEVSPDLYEMWTKGIAPYTANILTKILRFPATILRAGAVLNPKFIQKNFIRDTWGSWLFTRYGKSVKDPVALFIDTLYSPFAMMAAAAKKGTLYVEWMKAGGSMSTMQSLDREGVVKKLDEVRHGIKPHHVMKWLRELASISEEANRLSEFGKALEVEGRTRLGKEIAAFAARDLSVDFAKIGLQTKALNQIIPFWNATVQGGDKLLRALNNPEDRKNFLPRVLGFLVIPSLIFAWLNKDDEKVKEFYEEEKDFNFITRIGDKYIKIPVPFETGVIAHGLTQRMFNYFMSKDPEAFEGFMGSVMDAMLPNFIPTIANPLIEVAANKNFFTGAPIIPKSQEGLIAKYQYKGGTSSTARLLGRAMTYMLGQETRSRAASPAVIDHFITSWTGGLGRLMITISDASLEAAGLVDKIPGPEQAITERLGLDAFTAKYPRALTRSIEKFYDNYADATARLKSIKYAEKLELETEGVREAAKQRFEKIYDYRSLQMAYKGMQNAQREVNNIWNDPSIDPELKKMMIDNLYIQMIDFAQRANEDIKQYHLT